MPSPEVDCFVACALRNDGGKHSASAPRRPAGPCRNDLRSARYQLETPISMRVSSSAAITMASWPVEISVLLRLTGYAAIHQGFKNRRKGQAVITRERNCGAKHLGMIRKIEGTKNR
jgi:hypothetical protein